MAPFNTQLNAAWAGAIAAPLLSISLLALTVGIWILVRERGRQVSISFFASALALATYLFGFALMAGADSPAAGLFWGKVAYIGIPFIVPAIYHFSVDLLGIGSKRRGVVLAAWGVGVLYAVLAVGTDVLISGLRTTRLGYITDLTSWNIPFLLWSTTLLGLAIRDYVLAYHQADPIQKARIRWFAIPLVVASLGFIDYAPSLGVPVLPIGFVFFPVFLLSAAWAVGRYHLPDLTPAFAADQIIATMTDAVLVCENGGRIIVVNRAAVRLLEYDETTLQGMRLSAILGPNEADDVSRSTVLERDTAAYTRLGERIDVSISTGRIHDRNGRVIGTVVVARDIRERRRAAAEIERREQRFRALTEKALDTITILDAEGRIKYQSPAVRQLGYDPDEDIGANVFERVHPDDTARLAEAFRRLLEHPRETLEVEAQILRADGTLGVFELRAQNLLDNPAVGGVVVNGRDITEERQLEAQLQQAQKMEAIGRLAGGVAHDFNNILTAIQGNVSLLLEAVTDDSPLHPELVEVLRGAERAARLTDQLLAFSRRQVVRPELLDLNGVVAELQSMLERLIGEDLRLETTAGEGLPPVRADRIHIEQVLMNLVVNARDAVGPGGRIEVATQLIDLDDLGAVTSEAGVPPGSWVLLTVTDDGHGMDLATRRRIFEPFFTTKPQGKGTGLGLSTTYGTVRQAGGYIAVESAPGRGTRFSIYLPPDRTTPTTEPGKTAPAEPSRPQTPAQPVSAETGKGATILVVEDEAPVRALMKKILARRGYDVLEAEDGAAALRYASWPGRIDLLLTDLVMPGLGGREVAERLAADRPAMRTIFISGYTADEVVRRGVVSGEHVFLGKPFTPAELTACVASALDGTSTVAGG